MKEKKPFYKRWWFITIVVLVVIGMVGSCGEEESGSTAGSAPKTEEKAKQEEQAKPEEKAVEYEPVSATTLVDDLKANALKASNTWKDKYVEVTGHLNVIDSSGKYISIEGDDPYTFVNIRCDLKDEAQKEKVMDMSVGDPVTVKGRITEVGEILGYTINVDSIQ